MMVSSRWILITCLVKWCTILLLLGSFQNCLLAVRVYAFSPFPVRRHVLPQQRYYPPNDVFLPTSRRLGAGNVEGCGQIPLTDSIRTDLNSTKFSVQLEKNEADSSASTPTDENNNNDEPEAQRILQKLLERQQAAALQQFIQHEAPPWMSSPAVRDSMTTGRSAGFPFDCTACGKCCQTQGTVYLSPPEVQAAATYLNLSYAEFVKQYASHTLTPPTSPSVDHQDASFLERSSSEHWKPWIRLQEQQSDPRNNEMRGSRLDSLESTPSADSSPSSACIFLDRSTNQCRIYEARPIQCRTYPFWTPIMASVATWNAECRRPDDSIMEETNNHDNLPLWTPQDGGCEGMRRIILPRLAEDETRQQQEQPEATQLQKTCCVTDDGDDGRSTVKKTPGEVPFEQGYRLLYEYEEQARRFPYNCAELPVQHEREK